MTFRARVVAFDLAVDEKFAAFRSPTMDKIVYRLSSAADHSLLWHATGVAQALLRGGDVERAARFSIAMGVESAVTNGAVKSLFGRIRPSEFSELPFLHGLRRPITSSFPSGHATAAFCAAVMLEGGPVLYCAAAAVSATRVYVRLHHASDVVAGAALGVALGLAMKPIVTRHSSGHS
jgi:undecaprenyl-diphosphatase